jgi:hypothetical protein
MKVRVCVCVGTCDIEPPLQFMSQKFQGFMELLVADMAQDDSTNRSKMKEVVTRFSRDYCKGKLSTIGYVLGRKSAIPRPR